MLVLSFWSSAGRRKGRGVRWETASILHITNPKQLLPHDQARKLCCLGGGFWKVCEERRQTRADVLAVGSRHSSGRGCGAVVPLPAPSGFVSSSKQGSCAGTPAEHWGWLELSCEWRHGGGTGTACCAWSFPPVASLLLLCPSTEAPLSISFPYKHDQTSLCGSSPPMGGKWWSLRGVSHLKQCGT